MLFQFDNPLEKRMLVNALEMRGEVFEDEISMTSYFIMIQADKLLQTRFITETNTEVFRRMLCNSWKFLENSLLETDIQGLFNTFNRHQMKGLLERSSDKYRH